ncbi:MAG: hypothetical protein MRZ36_07915 [Eubacterium sp.]|nr:hypothetical protein [Eubacterium sp.]
MNHKKHKKRSLFDIASTVVLVAFAVGLVATIGIVIKDKVDVQKAERQAEIEANATAVPATPTPYIAPEDRMEYSLVIAEATEKKGTGSSFHYIFNKKDGTFQMLLNAGDSSSELNHGTFTETDTAIEIVKKDDSKDTLIKQGDYLISENSLYDGKVPDKKTFTKTFKSKSSEESISVIEFKKDGTFAQNITRYSAGLDGGDQNDASSGTYYRKGNQIIRKKDSGEDMMPLYIYKDQLCANYYKKVD